MKIIYPPDPDETAQAYSFGLNAPYYVVVSILYAVKEYLVFVVVVICIVVYYILSFIIVILILYAAYYIIRSILHVL